MITVLKQLIRRTVPYTLFSTELYPIRVFCRAALVILISFVLINPSLVSAAINQQINYQGKLTDSSNIAVSDGNYTIVFSLYTASSGGSNVWTETKTVSVTNGLFSVMLGSDTSLASVNFNQTLYLGVKVGSDAEMAPRKVIGAVPAAFEADKLDGIDSLSFVNAATTTLPNVWNLPGLGQYGSSTATTTALGNLAVNGTTILHGLLTSMQQISAPFFTATSGTASILPYASSTAITTVINYATNFFATGSTTLQNFTAVNSTTTSATTTNLAITGLGQGWLNVTGPNGGVTSSTSPTVAYLTATSTNATSTFYGNVQVIGNLQTSASSTAAGQSLFTYVPILPHSFGSWAIDVANSNVQNSTVYINPATAATDTNLLGLAVGGAVKFLIDAEGDIFANSLTLVGSQTVSTSSISTLIVENNSFLGDAANSDWTHIRGSAWVETDKSSGASSTALTITQSGSGNILRLASDYSTANPFLLVTAAGNVGIATSSPYAPLSVVGQVVASYFTATTSTASNLPYASTTGLTVSTLASTTNLLVSKIGTSTQAFAVGSGNITNLDMAGGDLYVGGDGEIDGVLYVQGQLISSGETNFTGATTFTNVPTLAHSFSSWAIGVANSNVDDATIYINPATAAADTNLIGGAVGGTVKFLVDAEGDIFANSITTIGGATLSTSTISTLIVENASYLGDAASNDWTHIRGSAWVETDKSSGASSTALSLTQTGTGDFLRVATDYAGAIAKFIIKNSGNVGIGSSTPFAKLSLHANDGETNRSLFQISSSTASATSTLFTVTNNGYVGIGTSSPSTNLYIEGSGGSSSFMLTDNGTSGYRQTFTTNSGSSLAWKWGNNQDDSAYLTLTLASGQNQWDNKGRDLLFKNTVAATAMIIKSTGNVGVGSSTPFAKFSIHANSGETNRSLFEVGSSTASATSTLFKITNSGFVGIGDGSPTVALDVVGAVNTTDDITVTKTGNALMTLDGTQNAYIILDRGNTSQTSYVGYYTAGSANWWSGMKANATNDYYISQTFGTSGSELVIKDSTGYVGLGTSTPQSRLSIIGNGSGRMLVGDFGTTNYVGIQLGGGGTLTSSNYNFAGGYTDTSLYINRPTGGDIQFRENNGANAQLTIKNSSGNVGIGTTSPTYLLTAEGTTGNLFRLYGTSGEIYTNLGARQLIMTGVPLSSSVTGSTLVINPSSIGASNRKLFGIAVSDSERFSVDAEGDVSILNSLTVPYASSTSLTTSGNTWLATSGGNVGINTTNPSNSLTVDGSTGVLANYYTATGTATSTFSGSVAVAGNTGFRIWGTGPTSNTAAGSVTIGATTPDNGLTVTRVGGSSTTFTTFRASASGAFSRFVAGTGITFDSLDASGNVRHRLNTDGASWIAPAAGDIGLGTITPTARVHVATSTASASSTAKFTNGTTGALITDGFNVGVGADNNNWLWSNENNATIFGNNNLETMRILAGGNVGIGTTTPGSILSIGNTGNDTINIFATATSTFGSGINLRTGCFSINNTCVGPGSGGSGTVSSGVVNSLAYYTSTGTTVDDASGLVWLAGTSRLGIATSTASSGLEVNHINYATSTSAAAMTLYLSNGFGSTAANAGAAGTVKISVGGSPTSSSGDFDGGAGGSVSIGVGGDASGSGSVSGAVGGAAGSVSIAVGGGGGAGTSGDGTNLGGAGGVTSISNGGSGGEDSNGGAGGTINMVQGGAGLGSGAYGNDGTVNIGNSSGQKNATLNVYGTIGVMFRNTATTNGVCHSGVDLDSTDTTNSYNLVACNNSAGDIAEFYPTEEDVEVGHIVATSEEMLDYEAQGSDPRTGETLDLGPSQVSVLRRAPTNGVGLLGVVSKAPFQTFGKDVLSVGSHHQPVALVGRVPVKVKLDNGEIKAGDLITLSTSTPGVGVKALTSGVTIGTALNNFTSDSDIDDEGVGEVLVFVNLTYSKISNAVNAGDIDGVWTVDSETGEIKTFAAVNMSGFELKNVKAITSASGKWSIDENGKLLTQDIETKRLLVEEGVTTRDKTSGDYYCIYVENGAVKTDKGRCEDLQAELEPESNNSEPEPEAPTEEVAEPEPESDPEPETPTEEVTPPAEETPVVEEEPTTTEPTPPPEPESTPEPEPEPVTEPEPAP